MRRLMWFVSSGHWSFFVPRIFDVVFPSRNLGESVASSDLGAVSFNFAYGSSRALPVRQSVGRQHFGGGVHCHETCSQCSNGAGACDALRKGHQTPELLVESACWRVRCWSTSSTAWRSFHLDLSGRQRETEKHGNTHFCSSRGSVPDSKIFQN